MKKSLLKFLLLPLVFGSLASCSYSKSSLTYGTYVSQTLYSIKELTNVELLNKTKNENETFLLAVYQGQYSEGCSCWSTFESVIVKYMNDYHGVVYEYNAQEQDDSLEALKIEKVEASTPYLYIYKGEKRLAKYCYNNKQEFDLFEDAEKMNQLVSKKVNKPSVYYVNDLFLTANLASSKDAVVLFARSGCGDCNYVLPNVLIPYINNHSSKKEVWIYDLQSLYDLSRSSAATEEEKARYQEMKDKYGLSASANDKYGYQNGVVPTMQYYQEGILKDSTVFFNDEVSQKEDGSFYLSNSFYSEERLANLAYLKGSKLKTVLKDMAIPQEEAMERRSGGYYWSQKGAAQYHTPLLKAFLDYYLF